MICELMVATSLMMLVAMVLETAPAQADGAEGDFVVAPGGNDAGPGTLEKPFETLERAREAVRGRIAAGLQRPVTVLLREGVYDLERSVVFSGRDSGTAECPITYAAYPGEKPVLRGCRAITGWEPFRDGIFVAQLPQTENQYWRFRELFLNGKRQIRARYPNHDPADPDFGGWAFIEEPVPADADAPTSFRCEPGVFTRQWAEPEQGEVFIIPGLAWNSHLLPIRSWDPETRTITVTRRLSQMWDRLTPGNRFYVENLLEELDQPGEWCFDSETQNVYFMPPGGTLEGAEVTVPVNDRLIELRATTGEPVRHLRFRGLTFTQTLSVFPHYHSLQPDYLDCNRPNSGGYSFYMENTEHCALEGCTFDQVGGDAIRLHGYSGYSSIVGNEIVGAGAQGICIANLELWPYDFPAIWRDNEAAFRGVSSRLPWAVGNVISRNHIHHCGVTDNFGAAIHLHGLNTEGNVISHNHIHDQPHHAIYLSMGFGRNVIEYNDLHTLCRVMADAGGVYSNRWCIVEEDPVLSQGLVVRYNRIRDVMGVLPHARAVQDPATTPSRDRIVRPHMTWGIYFDNSPRRAQVYGNLCMDNTWGGVFLGGGYAEPEDCVVENNIFVNSGTYQFDVVLGAYARGNRFRRNIVCYDSPDAALMRAGRAWKDDAASYAGWAEFDHNLYWQTAGAALRIPDLEDGTLEDWRKLGFDRNTLVADPLFVDAAKGDFRLKPDSPALKLGFAQLPLALRDAAAETSALGGWRAHAIRRGDGQGGWVTRPALRQVLRHPDCEYTMPFGLAQMGNGEIALVVSREKADPAGGRIFEPNIAFSKDGGATWSTFQAIAGTRGRPQFLTWLGDGRLSFVTEAFDGGQVQRFFSRDYGRTWTESVAHPGTREGQGFGLEGNGWVDRDEQGGPRAILEIGYHLEAGKSHPTGDFTGILRRSLDEGRTWTDEVSPPQWKFTVEHGGKTWLRGVSEGAVVRAANGDLVAALRTDMPPRYFDGPNDDSLEGTAISISRDDGKTWSDLQFLFEAGRHHANLQRMPNGDLVCTFVVRDDIQAGKLNEGELTSRRRGCDALVSHDHGRTWNLDRRYELDSFDFLREDGYWVDGVCGHIGAVALDDGDVLAVYGNYPVGAVLVRWRPDTATTASGQSGGG